MTTEAQLTKAFDDADGLRATVLVPFGREMMERLTYGPNYSRAAAEYFADAWRAAGWGNERGARYALVMSIIHAGYAVCGHDSRNWYSIPHTEAQKAIPRAERAEIVAYCGCGAFYRREGIDHASPVSAAS